MLELDFEYGTEIIEEIFRQEAEKEAQKIYYYANHNNLNNQYKTYNDFRKTIIPEKSLNIKKEKLSVDEIMQQVKNTLDLFNEE